MATQVIHVRLDPNVYLKLKASQMNMSRLANELFTNYFALQDIEIPEHEELKAKMRELEDSITKQREELANCAVMLTKSQEQEAEKEKIAEVMREAQIEQIRKSDEWNKW